MLASRLRSLALALLLCLAAACGGDDDGGSADDRPADPSPPASSAAPPVEGETFKDPQGSYELTIDRSWQANHGIVTAEIEIWAVGPAEEEFTPNVNILTQKAGGTDLDSYLDASLKTGNSLIADFALVNREVVDGTSGEKLGVIEYSGTQGDRRLRFLAVVTVGSGNAVVATLTTPVDSFAERRARVMPYLLTLHRV